MRQVTPRTWERWDLSPVALVCLHYNWKLLYLLLWQLCHTHKRCRLRTKTCIHKMNRSFVSFQGGPRSYWCILGPSQCTGSTRVSWDYRHVSTFTSVICAVVCEGETGLSCWEATAWRMGPIDSTVYNIWGKDTKYLTAVHHIVMRWSSKNNVIWSFFHVGDCLMTQTRLQTDEFAVEAKDKQSDDYFQARRPSGGVLLQFSHLDFRFPAVSLCR